MKLCHKKCYIQKNQKVNTVQAQGETRLFSRINIWNQCLYSIIHKNQKVKITKVHEVAKANKHNVVYTFSGLLLVHNKG